MKQLIALIKKLKYKITKTLFSSESKYFLEIEEGPDRWHRGLIEHFAFFLKPKVYVELGIRDCSVINRVIPHAEEVIGVDIDVNAGNFLTKSPKATFVCSSTLDFAKRLKENPITIDMLFIDADHACEAVLNDFYAFFPFIAPHGLILLHDTHPRDEEAMSPIFCNDAYKVVNNLQLNNDKMEFVTIPLHPGLTIVRKRNTQLSWEEGDINEKLIEQ